MYWRMMLAKVLVGVQPERAARSAVQPRDQLPTMPAMTSSRTKRTRSRTGLPATSSSASSIWPTVALTAGRLSASRPPSCSTLASWIAISPSTVRATEVSGCETVAGTGQIASSPASGSRMIPEKNDEAAPFGRPAAPSPSSAGPSGRR
jgi:hypothetical protein